MDQNLDLCSYKDTVPFVPPISYGKVVKVYDGDTLTLAAKLPYSESLLYPAFKCAFLVLTALRCGLLMRMKNMWRY